jgi:hypothetical protein
MAKRIASGLGKPQPILCYMVTCRTSHRRNICSIFSSLHAVEGRTLWMSCQHFWIKRKRRSYSSGTNRPVRLKMERMNRRETLSGATEIAAAATLPAQIAQARNFARHDRKQIPRTYSCAGCILATSWRTPKRGRAKGRIAIARRGCLLVT